MGQICTIPSCVVGLVLKLLDGVSPDSLSVHKQLYFIGIFLNDEL